jgi:predicted Zn-dependent peptidase
MPRERIKRFWKRHYTPATMVVAAAGAVDHDTVVRLVKKAFARNDFLSGQAEPVAPRPKGRRPRVSAGEGRVERPFEQVNLVLGSEGPARDDDNRFALGVVSTALGGGTSSRLFQEIRERRGLAYSVYSFASHYADSGLVGVALGCLPARADEALSVVREELARIAAHGIDADELRRGKGQLTGGLVLGLEDAGARMMRLGKGELVHAEVLGLDEVLARIDAVTLEECAAVAADVFARPEVLALVGPA